MYKVISKEFRWRTAHRSKSTADLICFVLDGGSSVDKTNVRVKEEVGEVENEDVIAREDDDDDVYDDEKKVNKRNEKWELRNEKWEMRN